MGAVAYKLQYPDETFTGVLWSLQLPGDLHSRSLGTVASVLEANDQGVLYASPIRFLKKSNSLLYQSFTDCKICCEVCNKKNNSPLKPKEKTLALSYLKMASSESLNDVEPPRKRQRLSPTTQHPPSSTNATLPQAAKMEDHTIKETVMSDSGFQPDREAQAGILHFVNKQSLGFTGTLKQRYVFEAFLFLYMPCDLDCFQVIVEIFFE
jgi:hypothetical protein